MWTTRKRKPFKRSKWLSSLANRVPAWFSLPAVGAPAGIIAILFCLALFWCLWPADFAPDPALEATANDIQLVPAPPPGAPEELIQRALADAGLGERFSLLEPALLGRLSEAFAGRPWVRRVERLEARRPAAIEIRLAYRLPVAMIETNSGLSLVDRDGNLLPAGDSWRNLVSTESAGSPRVWGLSLPRIVPPAVEPNDSPRRSERLRGAAQIAVCLENVWDELGLRAITWSDGAPQPGDSTESSYLADAYLIETTGGTRIIWGAAPGQPDAAEPPSAKKRERLRQFVADGFRLDDASSPLEVDLRPTWGLRWRPRPAPREAAVTRRDTSGQNGPAADPSFLSMRAEGRVN